MFATLSLARREFNAYFLSPIAYVVLTVFLFVTGHLFYLAMEQLTAVGPKGVEYPMQLMLGDEKFWLVFLFIPPLLTMRLFAEERGTGTLEMLMTAPVRDWQVVLSKFAACFAFYVLLWLPTVAYLPVLLNLRGDWKYDGWNLYDYLTAGGVAALALALLFGLLPTGRLGRWLATLLLLGGLGCLGYVTYLDVQHWLASDRQDHLVRFVTGWDAMPVATSYLGIVLAGAMFLALGLFVSSLVRSQMVAALVALVLSLGFVVTGFWRPEMDTSSGLYQLLYFFSVPLHFSRDFSRGLIDSRHVILYSTVALFCLFLTVRSLESRRWK